MTGILYLPIGIPGSGKSYFGAQHFEQDEIVSMDDYRRILTGSVSNQAENARVGDLVNEITTVRLSYGLDVYFDATNLQPKYWPEARHKVCILMTTEHDVSWARNLDRERVVPDHAMQRMIQRYKSLGSNWPKDKGTLYMVGSAYFDRNSNNVLHGE